MNKIKTAVLIALYESKDGELTEKGLLSALGMTKKNAKKLDETLKDLKRHDDITIKKGVYRLSKDFFTAEITRVNARCGFLTDEYDEEYFVHGRDLLGAIPGDAVLARRISEADEYEDKLSGAVVISILEESDTLLTGTVTAYGNRLMVQPDKLCEEPLEIARAGKAPLHIGDKVVFSIKKRGERHMEHTVKIVEVCGSCDTAGANSEAYLLSNGVHLEFPEDVLLDASKLASNEIDSEEAARRLDLRGEPIFTIDGADTKDIDDAVSIAKTDDGYSLGVHIADVSHYVKLGSAVNNEAYYRGTSIYYADKVVPMLPKELSNGICSLNPGEDRLAFSCLMKISPEGILKSFRFEKTVIRSRVKGVYSEVNAIIDGGADDEIKAKYEKVADRIPVMKELADILAANREKRGAPELETVESKIITDKEGVCVDVQPRKSGAAEKIIEEFMLMANNAAASLAMKEEIPFVYRVHEPPAAEKLTLLNETLTAIGVEPKGISDKSTAADLAELLKSNAESEKKPVINMLVLRAMMKARYSEEPLGHYGLMMKEYAHFTSPIRRYADLSIHRILTDYVYALSHEKLCKKYMDLSVDSARRASDTELLAIRCERECENFYMAEYMAGHIGEEYEGIITGVSAGGAYVQITNTVEGMVPVFKLPLGEYEVLHDVILAGAADGSVFTVGDRVKVRCINVNVGGGFIDFEFVK